VVTFLVRNECFILGVEGEPIMPVDTLRVVVISR
jgi:hypothetical protein